MSTLLLPLSKSENLKQKPPKGGFLLSVDNFLDNVGGVVYNNNVIVKNTKMTIQKVEEIILTCDVCCEPLQARAVFVRKKKGSGRFLQAKPNLFCPQCDKGFNLISRFKKQYAKQKRDSRIAL